MLWIRDWAWPDQERAARADLARGPRGRVDAWVALDGGFARGFREADRSPGDGWVGLDPLSALVGASAGAPVGCLLTVEVDVLPEHEADLNAWYEQEHLPGLASVPGTIRAARYRRQSGARRYLASYHLTDAATVRSPAWLAVRATPWSDRVRACFVDPRRTLFQALR